MITRDLKKMEERKNKRIGVGRVVSSLCWSVYAMSIRSVRRTGTGTFTHPHPHQPSSPSDPHPHPHRHCHPHKVSTSPIQRENPNEKQTSKGRKEVAPPALTRGSHAPGSNRSLVESPVAGSRVQGRRCARRPSAV